METYLLKVLRRSAHLAIDGGVVVLRPLSGNTESSDKWLKANRERLLGAILRATEKSGYLYVGYSTGHYGEEVRASGVTLQFTELLSGATAYAIFNASLKRARSTEHGKGGALLPKGRFIPGKRSAFVRFWRSTQLNEPRSLSCFHDCIGKLGGLVFAGRVSNCVSKKQRLDKGSLAPLNIGYDEILKAVEPNKSPDKDLIRTRQAPDNSLITTPDKHSQQTQQQQGIQPNLTTDVNNYEIKVKGNTGISNITSIPTAAPIPIQDESVNEAVDEWISDYDGMLAR